MKKTSCLTCKRPYRLFPAFRDGICRECFFAANPVRHCIRCNQPVNLAGDCPGQCKEVQQENHEAVEPTRFRTTVTPRLYAIWLCQEVVRALAARDRAHGSNVMTANRRDKMATADARIDAALAQLKALHEAQLAGKEVEITVGA